MSLKPGDVPPIVTSQVVKSLFQAMRSGKLGTYCGGTHSETCACGGGWFNGVHISHDEVRQFKQTATDMGWRKQ